MDPYEPTTTEQLPERRFGRSRWEGPLLGMAASGTLSALVIGVVAWTGGMRVPDGLIVGLLILSLLAGSTSFELYRSRRTDSRP